MPIAYTDIHALTQDVTFQKRLQVALWREASKLLRQTNPVPPENVIAWAQDALRGPSQKILEVTIRVSTAGVVYNLGAAATDSDIQGVVANIVTDLAG